jgi:hypothetical protein
MGYLITVPLIQTIYHGIILYWINVELERNPKYAAAS